MVSEGRGVFQLSFFLYPLGLEEGGRGGVNAPVFPLRERMLVTVKSAKSMLQALACVGSWPRPS